jgi:hypothetical protein
MSSFQDTYLNFLRSSHVQGLSGFILPTISNWIKQNKGMDVSTEEMLNALKIDSPASFTVSTPMSALTPPPATSGGGRKKANVVKPIENVDPNGGCIYVFTRKAGDKNKGDRCGQPTVNGTTWCKSCIKKTGGGNQKNTSSKSPVTSGLTSNPPLTQINNSVSQSKDHEIEITALHESLPSFYYEENTGILIEVQNDGTYTSYGIYNSADRSTRSLTETEKEKAKAMTFLPCNDANVVNEKLKLINSKLNPIKYVTVQPSNGVPSMPTIPAMQQLPTVNANMGLPTISALPSVNSNIGMPMIPTGVNMSMMPGGVGMPIMPTGINVPANGFAQFNPSGGFGIPVVGK